MLHVQRINSICVNLPSIQRYATVSVQVVRRQQEETYAEQSTNECKVLFSASAPLDHIRVQVSKCLPRPIISVISDQAYSSKGRQLDINHHEPRPENSDLATEEYMETERRNSCATGMKGLTNAGSGVRSGECLLVSRNWYIVTNRRLVSPSLRFIQDNYGPCQAPSFCCLSHICLTPGRTHIPRD